jgi:N-methylhydantoinase A/oxoprolinase/acetone carboxylase beta subunit
LSVDELVQREGCAVEQFLPLAALEDDHVVQRCGLTPTDLLHAAGRLSLWDAAAAGAMCDLYAKLHGVDRAALIEQIETLFARRLAIELLKKQLDDEIESDELESAPAAMALIRRALDERSDGCSVRIGLRVPVIGIGAPAHFFLPRAARLLQAEAIVPEHADVANALGAITSPVRIHRRATIAVDENSLYRVEGLEGTPSFADLDEAQRHAVERLCELVRDLGRKAGTTQATVEVCVRDRMGDLADGAQVFLTRVIEARLTGSPDLARFAV